MVFSCTFQVNLADEDAILDSLENDWEMWGDHYIAYTIATLLGVFFCLFMPILGCLICCCRKSGRCGGKFEPIEKKYEKCKRIICGSLLLIFSVVILLGTTSCFLSTRLVRDQTVSTGTMQDISSSLFSVDMYFANTQEEIWNLKSRLFETPYHQIQFKLRRHFLLTLKTKLDLRRARNLCFAAWKPTCNRSRIYWRLWKIWKT